MNSWLQRRVARHALFWAGVSSFFMLMFLPAHLATGVPWPWKLYVLALLPAFMLATYSLLYGVLPRLLRAQQDVVAALLLAGWVVASAVLCNLMGALYGFVLAPALFQEVPDEAFKWTDVFGSLHLGFFPLLLVAGLASAIKLFQDWHKQQQLSQQLFQRKLQAELALLKAQLQPAFLFSTLASLRALTTQNSPDSPAAVLHLSALLRYMLYESQQDTVPLADEAEMMQHYVALEQLRLGGRVEVSFSFSGTLGAYSIAPLLLLPFVENAFRHGTGPELECPWVSIDLVAQKRGVSFKVLNSQAWNGTERREGLGLGLVRQRLRRLYPDRQELDVEYDPDIFLIALRLQVGVAEPADAAKCSEAPTVALTLP